MATNDMIDEVISSDEVGLGRPHPFMIYSLMDRLQISDVKLVEKWATRRWKFRKEEIAGVAWS